jgi:hypothetical protein
MTHNDFYIGSEYKRRDSPILEKGALPIRREIEQPQGHVPPILARERRLVDCYTLGDSNKLIH